MHITPFDAALGHDAGVGIEFITIIQMRCHLGRKAAGSP
jgi:hypothetical protein